MAGERQCTNPQATGQIEAEAGYSIPTRRMTWLRIYLLVLLAAATATLAVLLSGDPADRPW